MIPYIIFYIFVFLLSFKIKQKKFNIFDFILIFIIIFFSGLRTVGVDYNLYKQNFYYLTQNSILSSRTGMGYAYFSYFVKYILKYDFQFIVMIFSIFTNLIIYLFFKKYSSRPGTAILVYISFGFYTTSFNMFRQMFSLALCLLGVKKFEEKNFLMMLVFYMIAFFIHSSSIIAIISYTILFKYNKKYLKPLPLFFIFGIFVLFYNNLFPLVISYFRGYSMYLMYDSTPGIGTYMIVSVFLIIYLILIFPNKNILKTIEGNYTILNLFTIGVSVMIMELKNFLFFRIAFYFTFFISILLVDWFNNCYVNDKIKNLLFYIFMFVYFLIYINSFDGVMPYAWILC